MLLIIYHDGEIIGRSYLDSGIHDYPYSHIAVDRKLYKIVDRKIVKCVGDGDPVYNMYFTVVR